MSPAIQNYVIDLLETEITKAIRTDLKKSSYFSMLVDTTQDIAKIKQISLVIIYVSTNLNENDIPTKVTIN